MAVENESVIKNIINKTEVSLILDTYDDIFSDFDPRPFSERALSEDFLTAAKRATRDKGEDLELQLLIPKDSRNGGHEEIIKQRLKEYFKRHYRTLLRERIKRRNRAIIMIVIGFIIGLVDAFILTVLNLGAIPSDTIGLLMTPASWYTIWTGFDHLFSNPEDRAADEAFFKRLRNVHVTFVPY